MKKKNPAERVPLADKQNRRRRKQSKLSLAQTATKAVKDAARIKHAAELALVEAETVFKKADLVDERADELHQSIHQMHERVHGHSQSGTAGAIRELVVDEKLETDGKPFPIVGIGASAGGFEAFTDLLQALPTDTGMGFVLVQHLDPKHKSNLTDLLVRNSKVPVLEAKENLEVEPDHIYVIPENTTIALVSGRLRLSPRKMMESPPMPIDHFFRSLAKHQRERAIGIVLSGTGSDGTLGLEAIKGEGGLTFAQDESSAKYFGMPGSAIASGSVDSVLSVADMARELGRIARHPYIDKAANKMHSQGAKNPGELERLLQESTADLTTLFSLLRARTGVDFSLYKQSTLKRRIIRRMVLHKVETLKNYLSLLRTKPSELDDLFHDMLINVTGFFRDSGTFQILKKKIFPRIAKAHSGDSPLRFWVCGCASGEEAYSLAICLVEFFEENYAQQQAQIFATDVSETSIDKARAGIYPENIQQDISAERLRRFFTKVNGNYQVHKSIRDMCIFARQNLANDPPFSNLDLVTCRNVLIYFGPTLQRRIIPMFHYSLRTTGFLLLGGSESIGASTEFFSLMDRKHKIYVKKANAVQPGFELSRRNEPRRQEMRAPVADVVVGSEARPLDLPQQVDRILLRSFSPAAVVINADLEVVHFRGRTSDYLEHVSGTASLHLLKMVRESLALGLRTALSRATKQDSPVRQEGVEIRHNLQVRELTLDVVPFRLGPSQERFFLVVFKPIDTSSSKQEPAARIELAVRGKAGEHKREVSKLHQELTATKESLQSIIEEQEATNEELKSANEEIQSSNEELQSTNEELETAKEELQSTNEELSTLNEELQNRNGELSQLNDDLTNLLASVNVAIIMLGNDLRIRRFTPMAERIFSLIPADVGRRLTDLSRAILVPDLEASVREVIDNLTPLEREAQDREGRWYLLRIRPYRTRDNKIDGAVILLIDIDEPRRALDVLLEATNQPLLILGPDCKVRKANKGFCEFFGIHPEAILEKSIFEAVDGQWNLPSLKSLLDQTARESKQPEAVEIQSSFANTGWRRLRVTARRFFQESRGVQIILVAFEEVAPK